MNWQQISKSSMTEIVQWAEKQAWAEQMKRCDQDQQWHAEGDVWTHTKMVCHQLTCLDEWPELSNENQIILLFTALLHDVAKPLTSQTDPYTGRVSSPKHAVKGEGVARNVLRELDCDLETREHICKLVRYHGRPVFLNQKSFPEQEVIRLSWLLSNRLLYLFALADRRGREAQNSTRPEENLHYWKLLAEELGCYQAAYPFANNGARIQYIYADQPNLHYVPHEEYSCRVTMLSGLPGSGKNRWLETKQPQLPTVSLDDIRQQLAVAPTDNQGTVAQLAKESCREFMRNKTDFAFNATNISRVTRDRWLRLFADYKAYVRIVYLEPSLQTVLRQNKERSANVPERVLQKLAKSLDPPTWLEGHELIWVAGN